MKYNIEICHPNDILANAWRKVDECEHPVEYLQSPVFEWQRGTVVRVPGMTEAETFYGIFGEHECVNVSANSTMMKSIERGDQALPTYWRNHNKGDNLLLVANKIIVNRKYVEKAILALAEDLFGQFPNLKLPRTILNAVKEKAVPKVFEPLIEEAFVQASVLRDARYYVVVSARDLAYMYAENPVQLSVNPFITDVVKALTMTYSPIDSRDDRLFDALRHTADIVRATIPFYEIALGVT